MPAARKPHRVDYVVGDACPAQLIAQLERQGARRLRDVGGS
jgi:hypothetical protein